MTKIVPKKNYPKNFDLAKFGQKISPEKIWSRKINPKKLPKEQTSKINLKNWSRKNLGETPTQKILTPKKLAKKGSERLARILTLKEFDRIKIDLKNFYQENWLRNNLVKKRSIPNKFNSEKNDKKLVMKKMDPKDFESAKMGEKSWFRKTMVEKNRSGNFWP